MKEVLPAGELVCIEEADDGLGLRPPMLFCLDDSGWARLVDQPSIGVDRLFVDSLRHLYRRRLYAGENFRIA